MLRTERRSVAFVREKYLQRPFSAVPTLFTRGSAVGLRQCESVDIITIDYLPEVDSASWQLATDVTLPQATLS